jgi:exosome complex RNA-binding protein Rrp4
LGKISIGILIALSTAKIKRLIVTTMTVIGLLSAEVTIDIAD